MYDAGGLLGYFAPITRTLDRNYSSGWAEIFIFQISNYQHIAKEMAEGGIILSTLRSHVAERRKRNVGEANRTLAQSGSMGEREVRHFLKKWMVI